MPRSALPYIFTNNELNTARKVQIFYLLDRLREFSTGSYASFSYYCLFRGFQTHAAPLTSHLAESGSNATALVSCQTLWFIAQCLSRRGRRAHNLDITRRVTDPFHTAKNEEGNNKVVVKAAKGIEQDIKDLFR